MVQVELTPIGEAARRLGVRTSTLRYYDERGLVRPAGRAGGRRVYGPDDLRRAAFVHLLHQLGIPLATAAAILDEPDERWRRTVEDELARLHRMAAVMQGSQVFLQHALDCPHADPAKDCPEMVAALDRLLHDRSIDGLASMYSSPSTTDPSEDPGSGRPARSP